MVVLKLDGLTRKGIGEMIDRVKSAGERLHLTQNVNISDILKEGSDVSVYGPCLFNFYNSSVTSRNTWSGSWLYLTHGLA